MLNAVKYPVAAATNPEYIVVSPEFPITRRQGVIGQLFDGSEHLYLVFAWQFFDLPLRGCGNLNAIRGHQASILEEFLKEGGSAQYEAS